MQEFEFISPKGGTLIWVPGDTVQENLGGLSDEAYDQLKTELTPIFNQFTLLLSGSIVEDSDDRSSLLALYNELFKHFIKSMLVGVTFGRRLDTEADEEPGNEP